jgi:hypothetical protein
VNCPAPVAHVLCPMDRRHVVLSGSGREEFPAQLRIYPLLAVPILLVFVLMLYWLVRVLFTNRFRRLDS